MRNDHRPQVRNGFLVDRDRNGQNNLIQVGSAAWNNWLNEHAGFVYESSAGHFTARREVRRGKDYWYGYRRREGKLSKTYLGKTGELTREKLEQASAHLAGEMPLSSLAGGNIQTNPASKKPTQWTETLTGGSAGDEYPFRVLTNIKAPPLPPGLIPRTHLTQKINTPVAFICAPSGYGKSTLMNEWAQSSGMPIAWVTLEEADNNAAHFWTKVVAALQVVNPSLGEGWFSQMLIASPSALTRIVVNLTNDIVQLTDKPGENHSLGLVLDNYHHIKNPEIHTSLQTWLEHLPATQKLVVASLTQLPLSLGYLKAKGMVVEFGINDLRFTLEEGIEFLQRHPVAQSLAVGEMQKLVKRTEGWITGLVLAANALSQQDDHSRFMETFSGAHPLFREYFMDNVMSRQPKEHQTFLIKTSILKHLTGELCNAITGTNDGSEILANLWEQRLFIEKIEDSDWYRYHRLFADMLRAVLKEQMPAEIISIHRKAAKWYRARNDPTEAIYQWLACEEWEKAAALIESVALNELGQLGEDSRLLRWLQQLPEEIVQQHKILLEVYIRLAGLVMPPKAVDDFLSRSEKRIAAMPASEKTSDVLRTLADIRRLRRLWTKEDRILPGARARKEHDAVGQMLDGILRYHRESRDDLIKAELMASEVYEAAKARGHLFSVLMAGGACANLAFSQGHLSRSEQIAHTVLKQASEFREKLPEPASIALVALANVNFERNQLTQAQQQLELAIEVNPEPISTDESISMAILRAKIQSIQGDLDSAVATIQSVREMNSHQPSNLWLDQDLVAYQALFHLHQGDFISTERLLGGGWEIDKNPFSAFVRASLLMDRNRHVAAEEILSYLLERFPHSFYWVPILRVRVMLGIALFTQQKINQARQVMAEAARIAAPECFVRPFIFAGPRTASFYELVLHTENLSRGTRSFLKGVLTFIGHADYPVERSNWDDPFLLTIAASISPREQEILQSLSLGLSNRDIAKQYSISDSTVKTHLENIYRKLGVGGRVQAVTQARFLNLV